MHAMPATVCLQQRHRRGAYDERRFVFALGPRGRPARGVAASLFHICCIKRPIDNMLMGKHHMVPPIAS